MVGNTIGFPIFQHSIIPSFQFSILYLCVLRDLCGSVFFIFWVNPSRLIVGYFAAASKEREKSGFEGFFRLKNILKDGKKIL